MNVAELIAALQKIDSKLLVIADDHSEFGVVARLVITEEYFDNGGYISKIYSTEDKVKSRPMVYICADRAQKLNDRKGQ